VTKDAKHQSLREQPRASSISHRAGHRPRSTGLHSPSAVREMQYIRRAHTEADTEQRSSLLITTFPRWKSRSNVTDHRTSRLHVITAFGALALRARLIGLYGVLAYAVTRRTMRLESAWHRATRSKMVWLILREAMALAATALYRRSCRVGARRISRALLYGVESFDLPTFACALLILLVFPQLRIVPASRAGRLIDVRPQCE